MQRKSYYVDLYIQNSNPNFFLQEDGYNDSNNSYEYAQIEHDNAYNLELVKDHCRALFNGLESEITIHLQKYINGTLKLIEDIPINWLKRSLSPRVKPKHANRCLELLETDLINIKEMEEDGIFKMDRLIKLTQSFIAELRTKNSQRLADDLQAILDIPYSHYISALIGMKKEYESLLANKIKIKENKTCEWPVDFSINLQCMEDYHSLYEIYAEAIALKLVEQGKSNTQKP